MKFASVERLPQDWKEILQWVADGEEVELIEREQLVARVVPARSRSEVRAPASVFDLQPLRLGPVLKPFAEDDDLLGEMLDESRN